MIVNRIHVPIVSSLRNRPRNSSAANQTIRITDTYAQPCQASAITQTERPARRAYSTLVRFSLRNARSPVTIESLWNQFSTQRLRPIVRRARRKK